VLTSKFEKYQVSCGSGLVRTVKKAMTGESRQENGGECVSVNKPQIWRSLRELDNELGMRKTSWKSKKRERE
jgi:hypothetical protein